MFKKCLSNLTIPELTGLIGYDTVHTLDRIGISATKANLVEVIIESIGLNVLKSKGNRAIFFDNYNNQKALNLPPPKLNQVKSRPWKSCAEEIAQMLELDASTYLEETSERAQHFETQETFALMPYQNWMRKRVLDHFNSANHKRALLHMPTGAGKTSTAMQIIFDHLRSSLPHKTTVVWMAHSDELCEQAVQSFTNAWPSQSLGSATVWRAWGGQSNLSDFCGAGCNFVVTSFQTLYSWQKSAKDDVFRNINRLKKACDFLIVDEAHQSTAPTYASAIEYISGLNAKMLGLTATPGKHYVGGEDTQTNELVNFYEHALISMTNDIGEEIEDPIRFLQKKRVLCDIETIPMTGSNVTLSTKELSACAALFDLPESVLINIGEDHKRTISVASKVIDLAREQKLQTIVFCPSKANAIVMAQYLKLNECNAIAITGETDPHSRRISLEKFKSGAIQVITNYGVLTTGFDAPNIGAVVIARPTQSIVLYSQMIGRGIRGPLFGGTEKCIVLNVEDNITNLPDYRNASTYFNKYYS